MRGPPTCATEPLAFFSRRLDAGSICETRRPPPFARQVGEVPGRVVAENREVEPVLPVGPAVATARVAPGPREDRHDVLCHVPRPNRLVEDRHLRLGRLAVSRGPDLRLAGIQSMNIARIDRHDPGRLDRPDDLGHDLADRVLPGADLLGEQLPSELLRRERHVRGQYGEDRGTPGDVRHGGERVGRPRRLLRSRPASPCGPDQRQADHRRESMSHHRRAPTTIRAMTIVVGPILNPSSAHFKSKDSFSADAFGVARSSRAESP